MALALAGLCVLPARASWETLLQALQEPQAWVSSVWCCFPTWVSDMLRTMMWPGGWTQPPVVAFRAECPLILGEAGSYPGLPFIFFCGCCF